MADPAIYLEMNGPTPIMSALLMEQPEDGEVRRIFGLGQRSDFGPSPAVAELLGPRSRRDVHRPEIRMVSAAPVLYPMNPHATIEPAAGFRPLPLLDEPTTLRGDQATEQGPDSGTITLPAIGDRLRAFAAARFAHQPLGPGAPTVVIPPAEG